MFLSNVYIEHSKLLCPHFSCYSRVESVCASVSINLNNELSVFTSNTMVCAQSFRIRVRNLVLVRSFFEPSHSENMVCVLSSFIHDSTIFVYL